MVAIEKENKHMRKKIVSILLSVTIILSLSACGNKEVEPTPTNEPTSEVVEEVEPTSTSEPIEEVESIPTPEVEETVVESMEELEEVVESETPTFEYAFTWTFPDSMNGYTQKFLNEDYSEWSISKTHYVATNGNEMNFTWEGPASLGESAGAGEKVLTLIGVNCELRAWTYGYVDGDYESCLEMDKETWTGFAPDDVPYVVGGYYNVETTEDVIKVVFAVENDNYKGYNCYITDSTNAICYQFAYHEDIETYDDTRAMNVVNSIEYWSDYTPQE